MLIAILIVLGAFGGWLGTTGLQRLFGRTWSYVILGFIALLCVVFLPLGFVAVLALDGVGFWELHNKHKTKLGPISGRSDQQEVK